MTLHGSRRALRLALVLAAAAPAAPLAAPRGLAAARADEGWRAEFDDICAKTQDAMALPSDELRRLIERSDALLPAIERLPEAERKVFARRLKACRDLYAFVLQTREQK